MAGGTYCGTIGDGCGATLACGDDCPAKWTCGADHICKGDPTICQADTCVAASGDRYCGKIGDGCGNTLDCGNPCPTGWDCVDNLCVGSPIVCPPLTCVTASGDHYCKTIGNGCGGTLECGDDCPSGWTCEEHVCKATPPICTPVACTTASGDHYCGPIGDGCGGTLDCGADCPTGWNCVDSICVGGPPACTPATCDTAGGGRYCGKVGDRCGGTLNCPADCLQPGWVCEDHMCNGGAACTKIACATSSGDHYCGTVGDNCGGSLDCGTTCPKDGWTCGDDHICKGGAGVCTRLSCTTSSGDHYCGTVGDGCGGTLECGNDCPAGWTCGTDHICKGGPSCTPATCDAPNGDHYCGTIGDKCGGTLDCGTTCLNAGWTCKDNMCTGDPTCKPLTCVASSADNYCGAIGDGCGGTLDCGTTCPKAGWACDNGLCKAGPDAHCLARTCTTAYGDQYCGTIGDGCGNSLGCGATCAKTGWACQDNLCKAGPTAGCVPLACTTANGDQYCGDIGDGCGSTVSCGTACSKTGWTCQDNLCKAGPTAGCTPLTCATASGDQYCGTIGDGCGNSLACGTTCSKTGWTCQNNLCKGGPSCTPVSCKPTSGGQYCGTIGDGCGNSLVCSTDCSAAGSGWTCQDNLCKGGATCTRLTCAATSADSYCGTIGDGCGGSLACSATCPKTGWVCDNGLCKAGPTAGCVPQACTTTAGDQYCGDIGDGCGSTAHCGTTCTKTGWTCQNNLCKAGPTAGCVPLTCTAATGDQYCGDIGDGCGSTVHCGTTCTKTGWTCQNNLCKAGPTAGCTPLTCTTTSGDQYCGTIGDGCGNSLDCGTACSKTGWTCQNNLCKAGPTAGCTPLTCNPAIGGQYCGTIGDGCGNSLVCSTDCSAAGSGWVCGSKNSCVGGPGCVPVTCNNAKGVQQYCGDVGDACGATLSCPAACASGVPCGAVTPNVCEPCGGLCLNRIRCSGTATTSISGTVYDPAGLNALYNVIVSIPNATLTAITAGAPTCASCDAQVSGQPIATALTDASGHFVLNNVPWNTDFPLVMQLGKWRRQITISASLVTHQCADNPIPNTWATNAISTLTNPSLRLPRKISDGDNSGQYTSMPKIALATGQLDTLECLLSRIGIDTSEFTNPSGTGHINLFSLVSTSDANQGGNGATSYASGGTFPVAQTTLFNSATTEQNYDIVMVNCAGGNVGGNYFTPGGAYMTDAFIQNLRTYVNGGGKAFLEHYFASFLIATGTLAAPYGSIATWESNMGNAISSADLNTYIDQSFSKGQAFSQWLMNVNASTTAGRLQLSSNSSTQLQGKYTARTTSTPATRWIYNTASPPAGASNHVHYFDLLTPTTQDSKCGRIVYTGVHVSSSSSGTDQDSVRVLGGTPVFPTECKSRPLNSQEKALEFMFFDLSGCVNPPELPPTPAPVAGA